MWSSADADADNNDDGKPQHHDRPDRPAPLNHRPGTSWRGRVLIIRHTTGWSREELSKVSGIKATTIATIENRKNTRAKIKPRPYRPTLDTIRRIRHVEDRLGIHIRRYLNDCIRWDRLPIIRYETVCIKEPYSAFETVRVRVPFDRLSRKDRWRVRRRKRVLRKLPLGIVTGRPEDLAPVGRAKTRSPALLAADKRNAAVWNEAKAAYVRRCRLVRASITHALCGFYTEIIESWSRLENDPVEWARYAALDGPGTTGNSAGMDAEKGE